MTKVSNAFRDYTKAPPPPQKKKNLLSLTTGIIDSTNLVRPMDVSILCAVIMIRYDAVQP
jgi:hypothetical protein